MFVTFHTIIFEKLKVKWTESRSAGGKRILTWNSHSRSISQSINWNFSCG